MNIIPLPGNELEDNDKDTEDNNTEVGVTGIITMCSQTSHKIHVHSISNRPHAKSNKFNMSSQLAEDAEVDPGCMVVDSYSYVLTLADALR